MRIPILFAVLIGLVCGTCATALGWSAAPFGPNDYAFMAARPYYQEVSRGQKRFYNFLRRANKNQQLTLAKTPYVAIESYTLSAGEVPGLIWKMALGKIPARGPYGTDPPHDPASIQVEFLLIFDQRTGQLAAPEGVLVINPPVPGTIGQFGGVQAVYAGTGWW